MRQLIATCPVCWQSNEAHSLSGALPSAMLTPRMSSLIATLPLPSQSPTQPPAGGIVAVGVTSPTGGVGVAVGSPPNTGW